MTALPLSTGSYLVVGESNKFKLTDSIIRSFNNRGNKILRIWATQLKGFHISITQKNHKSFYFTYRNNFNRKKWLKIGDFPKINTTQARKLVQQSLGHTILKMTQRYAHFVEKDQIFTNNIVSNKIYSLL